MVGARRGKLEVAYVNPYSFPIAINKVSVDATRSLRVWATAVQL
jgi:hypothetical protein